jgi:hypothetical protein
MNGERVRAAFFFAGRKMAAPIRKSRNDAVTFSLFPDALD